MSSDNDQHQHEQRFPPHTSPRVWFIACANNPIGYSVCKQALDHGDCVIAGLDPPEFEDVPGWMALMEEFGSKSKQSRRFSIVALNTRVVSQCQAAVAEAIALFDRIDILCCASPECVVGTVEELGQEPRISSLVQNQFETNFFGPVNIIKAALPSLRSRSSGHIILLSIVAGHLGTPGFSAFCASQWAIEGYCDCLAYEVAPFNIKVTIIQPQFEVVILTNRITSAPPMQAYEEENNPAPLVRNILSSLLDRIEGSSEPTAGDQLHSSSIKSFYPNLPQSMQDQMIAETVSAMLAVGGHENPPARHIVGVEGVQAVKEKLKTVSEELEDFAECSCQADVHMNHHTPDG